MSREPAAPEESDRAPGAPHPRLSAALYGQEAAEAHFLAAARSGRAARGWLITGPRGTGKATLAWRIARFLLAGGTAESLELAPEAEAFRAAASLAHPGLFLVRRPWDSDAGRLRAAITVDEVRALKAFFQLSAADAGARVAIVDAADELNVAAANALLKLLEEPPAGAALLLVSHRPTALLPTIRSRCVELRCRPLAPDALAAALAAAGLAVGPADAAALAELAGGSVGAAARLIDGGGVALYGEIAALIAGSPPVDRGRLVALAEAAAGRGADARYAAILELADLALGRLARAAAGIPIAPAHPAEAEGFARLAARPGQAAIWAEAAARLGARAAQARAVRLDPAGVILDTFLQIDAAAAQAARAAA